MIVRALYVSAFAALLGAGACRQANTAAGSPAQTMEDFVMEQTVHGARVWDLSARSAVLRDESGEALLSEPTMRFYRSERVVSRVSSLTGRVVMETHDVFLSSSVVLNSVEDRSVLDTSSLSYVSKRNLFTTDAEVRVRRPEGDLRGRGLEAKPDLSEIRIFHQRSEVKEGQK